MPSGRMGRGMLDLYLSRHGESTYEADGIADGDPTRHVPLTGRGRKEAADLGAELRSVPIELCVTSEFPRTRETADIALRGRDVPIITDAELNDIRYGIFEGKPLDDFHAWEHSHSPNAAPRGGESRRHVAERCVRALTALLAREERIILVVSHEMVVGYILNAARGTTPQGHTAHLPPATPFVLPRTDVEKALQTLRAWLDATS